jgi:crossover junction endodeoxyribonuclease RuvC
MRRLIGLDPGLRATGWGVIDVEGNRLRHVANGVLKADVDGEMAARLRQLFEGLMQVLERWNPSAAAVESVFINKDQGSSLKLGQARGVVLLAPALRGMAVAEYAPNQVKKALVGVGHAEKIQIRAMVGRLMLPSVMPIPLRRLSLWRRCAGRGGVDDCAAERRA